MHNMQAAGCPPQNLAAAQATTAPALEVMLRIYGLKIQPSPEVPRRFHVWNVASKCLPKSKTKHPRDLSKLHWLLHLFRASNRRLMSRVKNVKIN